MIGSGAGNNASQLATVRNSIAIGYNTYTTLDNTIVLGNTSIVGTGIGTFAPAALLHLTSRTTTTNAVKEVERLEAIVSTASTGGAAGFGVGQSFYAETATDGTSQLQGLIATYWIVAANATRTAGMKGSVNDYNGERVGWDIGSDGANPMLSFYGGTKVVRGAALTAADASAVNSGDATTDAVINNMRTRINELEARLGSATGVNLFA
jgi:hypothetical protein